MNHLRAELLEHQETTGRFRVVMTLDKKIKIAAIKPENLTVELSVLDATKRCAEAERVGRERASAMTEAYVDERMVNAYQLNRRISSLRGETIVQRIRENDRDLMQAFFLPEGANPLPWTWSKKVEMYEHGLIDACLSKFKFPDALDDAEAASSVEHRPRQQSRTAGPVASRSASTTRSDYPYMLLEETSPLQQNRCLVCYLEAFSQGAGQLFRVPRTRNACSPKHGQIGGKYSDRISCPMHDCGVFSFLGCECCAEYNPRSGSFRGFQAGCIFRYQINGLSSAPRSCNFERCRRRLCYAHR